EIKQAPATEVVEFVKSNPDVLFDLLLRLYRGMDGLLGRMVQLMSGSARERLIYELLVEARRFGTELPDKSIALTVNEKELGARAGLSRETVSREIHKLKDENLAYVKGKEIILKDLT